MPINKKAYRRYKIIDACLRNKMRIYPTMFDIQNVIEEKLDLLVSAETIQKDIAAMKLPYPDGFDAPIRYNRAKQGYEYTNPAYSIAGVAMNSTDIDAIKETIDILAAIGGTRVSKKFRHAIEKVLSGLKEELDEEDRNQKIVITDAVEDGRGFEHFDLFFTACRERIPLSFIHYSYSKRVFKSVTVHPILLKEFENRWYLVGFSETHRSLRTFGFDRIYSPMAIHKDFLETNNSIKEEYLNDVYGVFPLRTGKKERIEIKTSPLITNYFRAQKIHHSQKLVINPNGDGKLSFELIPSMELVRLFLSYGKQLQVCKPKRLVQFIEKIRGNEKK